MKQAPEPCDLLIHNALLLLIDEDDTIVRDGAVAVCGNRIVAVGTTSALIEKWAPVTRIDARGAAVHPGFVDAHIHISQYSARSVLPRMAGTGINMGSWKAALRPEDEAASVRLAALDYLSAGYTGFVDPGTIFAPDAVAEAAREAGIRLWLTDPYVADLGPQLAENHAELASPAFLARWPQSTDEAVHRLGSQLRRNDDPEGRIHGFVGLYGEGTASEALYDAAYAMAREHKVQFQEHRRYAPRPDFPDPSLMELKSRGRLGPGTTFVHMNLVDDEDLAVLRETGTAVVWCPYGQLQALGKGAARPKMVELLRAGNAVAAATDIPRIVNFDALGSLTAGTAAAFGHALTGHEVLRMRTVNAARSIGAGRITGSLEIGKRADLVVRQQSESEALGADPAWEAAVSGVGTPPRAVIVNGEIVFENGIAGFADRQSVAEAARASVQHLLDQTGL